MLHDIPPEIQRPRTTDETINSILDDLARLDQRYWEYQRNRRTPIAQWQNQITEEAYEYQYWERALQMNRGRHITTPNINRPVHFYNDWLREAGLDDTTT